MGLTALKSIKFQIFGILGYDMASIRRLEVPEDAVNQCAEGVAREPGRGSHGYPAPLPPFPGSVHRNYRHLGHSSYRGELQDSSLTVWTAKCDVRSKRGDIIDIAGRQTSAGCGL